MKKVNIILISAIVICLAIIAAMFLISGPENAETDSVAEFGEQGTVPEESVLQATPAAEEADTAFQERPKDSLEVEITEPVYVYLPEQESEDKNLVFRQWIPDSGTDGESGGKFQDVTNVNNAVTIPSIYGEAGEEISAEVRLCGQVCLGGFDLKITYDPTLIEFVSFEQADQDLIYNCDKETGTIRMNYLQTVNVEDALTVCQIKFNVISTLSSETPLDVEMVEAISYGENGEILFCNYSLVDAKVYLNEVAE